MYHPRSERLLGRARALRRSMTEAERRLWFAFLRDFQPRFRRQEVIGPYIVDFYCSKAQLVLELDGSQHCEPEQRRADAARTAYLERLGLRVIRFSDLDVMRNLPGVCEAVRRAACDPTE